MRFLDLLNARWFVEPSYAESYYPLLLQLVENPQHLINIQQTEDVKPAFISNSVYVISEYGRATSPENAPKNSIAIMEINGPITKYGMNCGPAGMLTKNNILERAIANPNIKSIVINIDSGGGEASAVELISRTIANSSKPIIAYVHGMAASAAYWIASHADAIVLDGVKSSVGSIGVYITFADFAKHYEARGVKIHRVYATQSTEKNKMFEDALKGDYKQLQADLDGYAQFFIDTVKSQRLSIDPNADTVFKGAMFYAEDAIKVGLADYQGTLDFALELASEMTTGDAPRKAKVGSTQTHTTQNQNTTMFEKFKALSALRGKKAAEITAEEIAAVNAELQANGVEGSFLTEAALSAHVASENTPLTNKLNSAKADKLALVKLFNDKATEADAEAFDIAAAITKLQNKAATTETTVNDGGKGANITETNQQVNVWDLPHNKAAQETL